jgi:hypothetical protein
MAAKRGELNMSFIIAAGMLLLALLAGIVLDGSSIRAQSAQSERAGVRRHATSFHSGEWT